MSTTTYALVVDDGPLAGTRYAVTPAGLTLGRASQCDIAIKDMLLSRSHCRFELRDGALWVVDLASANQTLVNNEAVDEKMLNPGDKIEAGQTTLRVEAVAAPTEGDAVAMVPGAASANDVVIDLGFGKSDAQAHTARKSFLRPVIWTLGAVLVLVVGTTFILDPARRSKEAEVVKPINLEQDKTLLIQYEKVEASVDNLFRYELSLSPAGMLAVKIDDLSGKNRHVRKEKLVEPALLSELIRDIEASGFFSLDKSYSGFAANPNQLNEWTLTVAIGPRVHTCRVTNRIEPEGFRALRERLETFSKNELGIWAIQFSSDKLTELARNALSVARKKFDERDVKFGNLHESIRHYHEAVFYLDTVNPKPDFYTEIVEGVEAAEDELDKRYEEQRFQANRAINLQDWPAAARELRILREMIPDTADSRNKEATQKLIDVEGRLKKIRR
ncbi:MAG TPA: FHA domain-containing protein [Kiritimatiellia bacterium]|nr:FHA domain-containing protein [Kiritimatiellia bacterium]HRU71074.1 FHA domain-containing protein [Kiritimatiellia bacterium]